MMMHLWFKTGAIAAIVGNLSLALSAQALPGDLATDVATWIEANPSFRDSTVTNLKVTRFNTAAQKFTFSASPHPPLSLEGKNSALVRSETIEFFDVTNGVSFDRLSEALRTIYGASVHNDFVGAATVYSYPDIATVNRSIRENLPTLAAQQGEILLGDRFAYWIEVIETDPATGFANRGHITVMLREDLDGIKNRISAR